MRAARLKRKKTQAQIAEELGISQVAVSMYESGDRLPPTDAVRRTAEAYGVRPEQLLPDGPA